MRGFSVVALLSSLLMFNAQGYAQGTLSGSQSASRSVGAGFTAEHAKDFLVDFCIDCHEDDSGGEAVSFFSLATNEKGMPSLEGLETKREGTEHQGEVRDADQTWTRVLEVIRDREMPPVDADKPDAMTVSQMVTWMDRSLRVQSFMGGTPPRRLSRGEYQLTLEKLFGFQTFDLPDGFPVDRPQDGFDNLAEGLQLSPALMEAYADCARLVADQVFPPKRVLPESETRIAKPEDLVISYSSSKVVGDAMRLGMKCDPIQRSCTWPSRIESKTSANYKIVLNLSTFNRVAESEPMLVKVFARDVSSADGVSHRTLRLLQEIQVVNEDEESFSFDATLYEGQTIVLHWANASLDSDRVDKNELKGFFESKQRDNPKYLAAWHAMLEGDQGQGFRGGIGWDRVSKLLAQDDLPSITPQQEQALLKKIIGNPVLYAETVVFDVFENGPALEIHEVQIHGPVNLVDGPTEASNRRIQNRFLGGDDHEPSKVIERFLTQAFRRPVDQDTVARWLGVFEDHLAEGNSFSESMHLVIRNILLSPRFLYRCLGDAELDSYDLATRLAYFLTSGPPDEKLRKTIDRLGDPAVLRSQANRLLTGAPSSVFVRQFTEQWLEISHLNEIIPEQSLKFSRQDQRHAKLEVEHFFAELLRENHSARQLVDPDFTWTSSRIAKNIYDIEVGSNQKKANDLQRFSLERGGRYGGLLGMSAVMMATGNGVMTQPVNRGVWVLERMLGMTIPPPPDDVPAITPDTQGANTPRDLLKLHTEDGSCARCHRRIDPLGLVLENFDPVGRWRETWPESGKEIDAAVVLFDGTKIRDVIELKRWLANHPEKAAFGLAKHLMVYATGRPMSYLEQRVIEEVVRANVDQDKGLRDLVLDLICSPVFLTK